jgi:hypothetical protein
MSREIYQTSFAIGVPLLENPAHLSTHTVYSHAQAVLDATSAPRQRNPGPPMQRCNRAGTHVCANFAHQEPNRLVHSAAVLKRFKANCAMGGRLNGAWHILCETARIRAQRLVANAERYYRIMYYGSNESWNHRIGKPLFPRTVVAPIPRIHRV